MRRATQAVCLLAAGLMSGASVASFAEPPTRGDAAESGLSTETPPQPVAAAYDEDWLFEEDLGPDPAERDPFEGPNRRLFGFNEGVYEYVLDPVAEAYEFLVPVSVRKGVRRFFSNLDEPVTFANHVLQGAGTDAGTTFGRFAVNTTLGIVGFFDPATEFGLERRRTDFGETLARYGTPAGPYIVLPLLGPATARDAFGEGIDLLLRPDTWLLSATPIFVVNAGTGLSSYDIDRRRLEALRETSIDFYSAMRGAYLMDRDAHVDARLARLSGESGVR